MWLEIQIFGFRALWSPYYFTVLVLIGITYFLFTTSPLRSKFGQVRMPSPKQQLLFYGGFALLYIAKGSPIDLMSHIMLGAHMIQMAVLYFLVPIMLIRGLPVWMWRRVIKLPIVNTLFRFFSLLLVQLALVNGLFLIYAFPV